jgi:hypothetical protein
MEIDGHRKWPKRKAEAIYFAERRNDTGVPIRKCQGSP